MQNPILETIYHRRSIRKFLPNQIPDDILETILDTGRFAPTARNHQNWYFVAVQNPELREQIRIRSNTSVLMPAWADSFFAAPTLILIFCSPDGEPLKDGSLAAQNMMLAAESLGLSTCFVNVVKQLFGSVGLHEDLLEELHVPKGYIVTGSIAIGYSDVPHEKIEKKSGVTAIIK